MQVMVTVGVALACLTGCSADHGLDRCPGERPSLESCRVGYFFADCGGEGAPRLGCNATECLWFTSDCAPADFLGSDCPATDVCCHDMWPFSDPSSVPLDDLARKVQAFGTAPWDGARVMALTVVVDAALVAVPSTISCQGPDVYPYGATPCSADGIWPGLISRDTATFTATLVTSNAQHAGWLPWIEVIEDPAGSLRARMCAELFTDLLAPQCGGTDATCADAGTVTVNRWPITDISGVVVDFTANFPNGLTVAGTFSY